jgi:DNA-binding transcriptional MerR regulator
LALELVTDSLQFHAADEKECQAFPRPPGRHSFGSGGFVALQVKHRDTISFYQKLGLFQIAGRTAGGYRLFDREQIRDLSFVRHAQELGFYLTEVKGVADVTRKASRCSQVQSMLKRKLNDVREKISSLSQLEAEIAEALRSCNRELRSRIRARPRLHSFLPSHP